MATPVDLEIVPRQLNSVLEDCSGEQNWAGDPVTSTFFASLSATFTEGERFLIDSIRYYERKADSPLLREHIKGFIRQEARHSRAHVQMNEWFLKQGYPMEKAAAQAHWGIEFFRKVLTHKAQLAVTMAIEHFTARFADAVLTNTRLMNGMSPTMRDIWQWHGLEEAEHRAVAMDVYKAIGGGHFYRAFYFIVGSFLFFSVLFLIQFTLLFKTGNLRWPVLKKGWRTMWGTEPGAHGMAKQMINHLYFDYLRRDFHPFDHDYSQASEQISERLLAANVFSFAQPSSKQVDEEELAAV